MSNILLAHSEYLEEECLWDSAVSLLGWLLRAELQEELELRVWGAQQAGGAGGGAGRQSNTGLVGASIPPAHLYSNHTVKRIVKDNVL